MAKVKLVDANYDAESGISYAKLSTDLGVFHGYAYLHPDDKDYASNYAGCRYAERRAIIQYLEKKKRRIVQKYDIIADFISSMKLKNLVEEGDPVYSYAQYRLQTLKYQIRDITEEIQMTKAGLKAEIEARPQTVDIIRKKQEAR